MKLNSILFFTALIFFTNSCDGQNKKVNSSENKLQKMEKKNSNEKLEENKITNLKRSMLEYMEMGKPSYTKDDVEDCVRILNDYTLEIHNSKSKDEGMKIVKFAVDQLNKLNEKCDFQLIETSEREQIAEIIILESSKKGYNKPEEDITENWREW